MLLGELYQTIEKLTGRIETHRDKLSQSEALTRNALVNPLLRCLGWDPEDPALVMPEYRLGNGIADYALLDGGKPIIMIEAKKLDASLEKAEEQGIRYCISDGIKYFAITDGKKWDVYETHRIAPIADKRIVSFDITDPSADVCLDALVLWRRNVHSGDIRKARTPLLNPNPPKPPIAQPHRADELPEPPAFPPVAEGEGNWQPLSQIHSLVGAKVPSEIRFPDGSISPVKYWTDIAQAVVGWLVQQDRLDEAGIPIQNGNRYILSGTPFHPDATDFKYPKGIGQFYLETDYNITNKVKNANIIIEKIGKGVSPDQFSVRFPE